MLGYSQRANYLNAICIMKLVPKPYLERCESLLLANIAIEDGLCGMHVHWAIHVLRVIYNRRY